MSFGWLGTFRQGQWAAFRKFILNERRDVGRRLAVIEAELSRIGQVTVYYAQTEQGITEERVGFAVSAGSALERLFQAYVVQGGNPFDVSMFLTPDSTYVLPSGESFPTQPYGGVIYSRAQQQSIGEQDVGGSLVIHKYWPYRAGGVKQFQDTPVVEAIHLARRFANQTISSRIHDLESRIIKQADLREQLLQEIDQMMVAVSGTVDAFPVYDPTLYSDTQGVVKIVDTIDRVFYQTDETGVPILNSISLKASPNQGGPADVDYTSLFKDISPDEDNTAL